MHLLLTRCFLRSNSFVPLYSIASKYFLILEISSHFLREIKFKIQKWWWSYCKPNSRFKCDVCANRLQCGRKRDDFCIQPFKSFCFPCFRFCKISKFPNRAPDSLHIGSGYVNKLLVAEHWLSIQIGFFFK